MVYREFKQDINVLAFPVKQWEFFFMHPLCTIMCGLNWEYGHMLTHELMHIYIHTYPHTHVHTHMSVHSYPHAHNRLLVYSVSLQCLYMVRYWEY